MLLFHKVQRYTALLTCMIILMIVAPIAPARWSWLTLEIAFDLILLAGVYPTVWYSSHRRPFFIITAVTLLFRWLNELIINIDLELYSVILTVVWIIYIIILIVPSLFENRKITVDVIVGAIVAYFLIAAGFAQIYILIEIIQPGSFSGIETDKKVLSFILFSLGSMSGVNLEPVVPMSTIARSIATLEVLLGTFYVAVTVARLVSLNIKGAKEPVAESAPRRSEPRSGSPSLG